MVKKRQKADVQQQKGEGNKLFAVPQKNPSRYEHYYNNYNLPELIKNPVTVNRGPMIKAAGSAARP
jgi:hypothetical protein